VKPASIWQRMLRFIRSLGQTESERVMAVQRMAAERSGWPITVVNTSGVLLWVNPAFADLCGRTTRACLGRPLGDLMHMAVTDAPGLAKILRCLQDGQQELISLVGSRADGSPIHLTVEVRPAIVEGALVLQWLDQTDHVQTSQQLQATLRALTIERERLGHILAGTQVGAWEINLITGEARMDEAWAAMFGLSLADVGSWTREKARMRMHPDDIEPTNIQIAEHVAGIRGGIDFEHRVMHKAGHWMWVHSRGKVATRTPDGQAEWLSGSHMDISLRKQQEVELEQQRAHLRTVLASLPGVVFEFTLSDAQEIRMLFLSEALMTMFGLEARQALANPDLLFTTVPDEDMAALLAAIRESARTLQFLEQEYRVTMGDKVRWLGVHAKPERRADGQVHWMGMLFDVTRRHELAEQLAQARNAAEAANRAKSAFLATMSHEIRSPMNGVLGMTDVLMSAASPEDHADAVQTIRESAGALLTLIDDILDFSKIEAGRLALERVIFNAGHITEAVAESLASSAAARQVAVRVSLAPNLPGTVWGDPTRFRQILFNLVSNAIKFSRARPEDFGRVHISLMKVDAPGTGLLLRVEDWGIGIAPETLPHLFQPFSQADASTTRRFGGTGLGLAIVQRLVNAMDGQIEVDTAVGRGTRIDVTMPLDIADWQPERPTQDLTGLSCLIACDEQVTGAEWQALLCAAGADVRWAPQLDLPAIQHAAPAEKGRSLVVVLPYFQTLPDMARLKRLRHQSGRDIRYLCLALSSQPHPLRFIEPDVATVRPMRRQALWRAMATLAGTASPEVHLSATNWQSRSPSAAPLDRDTARTSGRLVLVVEDQEVNQKVAVRQLALLGVLADIASDGEQGLAQWRNETYALVFTDLHMPRTDGYAMVKALRAEEAALGRHRTPVLALTANALRGEERRAREAGMDEYLTKPIPLEALHGALQRWLPATTKRAVPADCPPAASTPEPHHAGTVEPTLDIDVLRRLVGDEPEVLNEFLEDFRIALGTLAAELREAFRTSDLSQVGAVAHKLKSAAKAVGALPLAKLCERLCLVPGNLASSQQDDLLLQRERVDFERLVEALEVALQGLREGAPS